MNNFERGCVILENVIDAVARRKKLFDNFMQKSYKSSETQFYNYIGFIWRSKGSATALDFIKESFKNLTSTSTLTSQNNIKK